MMKRHCRKWRTLLLLATISSADACFAQERTEIADYFIIGPRPHIRAIETINDSTVWFAANRGIWGYTKNSGRTWHIDSVRTDTVVPEFRSLAVLNDSVALMLSAGSPAVLLRTTDTGKNWKIVYTNFHSDIFFDSMVFADQQRGVALGDPIAGCFQLISTNDGGASWRPRNCSGIPPAADGEACFAASNSNIVYYGDKIWFVTGGSRARLFFSADGGESITATDVPIAAGEELAGAFSLAITKNGNGIVAGGHYNKNDPAIVSLAHTTDGGKTWTIINTPNPFFGSCVRIIDDTTGYLTGHHGTFRVSLVNGAITELKRADGRKLAFHTLRISPSGRYLWLAGAKGNMARISLN